MSEQFEAGLRDLYAAAEMAHDAQPGLAVDLMVARTRRHRRARAAAVTMATAAAVVGVAVAGTAVVSNLDTPPAPPADEPVTGTVVQPTCGTALADLARVPADRGLVLRMGLDAPELTAGELTGWLGTTIEVGGASTGFQAEIPADYGFVVTQGAVVVGTTRSTLQSAAAEDGDPRSHDARIAPVACDRGALAPGAYEVVAYLPARIDTDVDGVGTPAVLVSDPVAFTVPDTAPLLPPDGHGAPDGASAVPPADPTAPLPDGDYLALVSDVDAEAGTVTADVVVLYFGQAAQDWVSANAPGTDILDGYVSDDPDGPTGRTIPLGDAPVWEVCWGAESMDLVERTGGVDEWATAPIEDGESLCEDTTTVPRGGLYWLDVRAGVVMQVVGQFVP